MEKDLKNSINYINKKTGKETGFSIPLNYLNNLEDTIAIKLAEEKIPKNVSFKIPKNYLDNLEDSILTKISFKEKEVKVISFKERVLKMIPYAAAASVILFIGLNSFVFDKTEEFSVNNLSDNDIEYWLDANTLNTNDITDVFSDEILEEENDFSLITINDEVIEDYIYSIDNEDILNEID